MATDPFIVHVARLRRNPGSTLHDVHRGPVVLAGPLDGLGIDPGRSVVPLEAEAECDITLRAFSGGIDATGTVRAPWVGICRRCTVPVSGELQIAVSERFGDGPISEDDLYPITDDAIDLGACARSAGRIATSPSAAALPRSTSVGLTSMCSGS
jgi:hypothetical protein